MSLNLLLASTSTIHGKPYLSYYKEAWTAHFAEGSGPVLFVPYARPGGMSWDDYTAFATQAFEAEGIPMRGIHTYASPHEALVDARGIFIGGGNTFVLLKTLIESGAFAAIDKAVRSGMPYMGSSAGSNVAGLWARPTICPSFISPSLRPSVGFLLTSTPTTWTPWTAPNTWAKPGKRESRSSMNSIANPYLDCERVRGWTFAEPTSP